MSLLRNLSIFECSKNYLGHIPLEIRKCSMLTSVDLGGNQLRNFPMGLCSGLPLKFLDISQNLLSKLPANIGEIHTLQHFNLRENRFTGALPKPLYELHSLIHLDLSGNAIQTVPEGISGLQNLQVLFLRGNRLDEFPLELHHLKSVRVLDLSDNLLGRISTELKGLRELRDLNLSNNQFFLFPAKVCDLKSLEKLKMCHKRGVKLTTLPKTLTKLRCLREFDFSDNIIQEIPDNIGELKNLTKLIGNNNHISCLPKCITALQNLQHLELKGNRLQYLPPYLGQLPSLKHVELEGNPLTRPPKSICDQHQMDTIGQYMNSEIAWNEKILQKAFRFVASNLQRRDFNHFCVKLRILPQDFNAQEDKQVPQKEKTMQALTKWRDLYNSEKETSFVGDQLVRTLVLAGLYTLSSQVQAIKIYAKAIRL
ncbi:leucine-rich repeat and death domain-containing protein 1-like isoform X2 [Hypomesus transpacificus]|nr:leucine-rich repeat and death domain-containing protein 1-like isoform X2 [Hypomesus transpacificus]